MKKIFFALMYLSSGVLLQAQESPKIDSVCKLVVKYFNERSPQQLYLLAGEDFKHALTEEAFTNVCNKNLFPLGEIKQTIFEKDETGVSRYKAVFSSATLTLFLSLDKNDKIAVFLFKPYRNEKAQKNYKVPSTNSLSTTLDKEVDSAVRPYISLQATAGLSVGILRDGKTFFYGYGETAKGNKEIPDEHTIYEIGSLSKTFTAILLADAVGNGKVKLDDPINKYLPDSIPPLHYEGIPISLKTLSNHSSGLPRMPSNFHSSDNSNPYTDYSDNDLFSFLKTFKPTRKPGEQYEYSNLAVGTLGVLLERVDGTTYEKLFIEKICKPLGMNETREFLRKQDSLRFAKGYGEEGLYNSQWDFDALQAAGAIRSTAFDLLQYANANLGNAPAKLYQAIELTHTMTFTQGQTKVGLGWHLITLGRDELIFHNGQTGGYHSYLAVNTKKKFAVVILSNCAKGTEDLGNSIMKWLEKN
jgi:CubicO group peptidase (beta-lactamase class C family)